MWWRDCIVYSVLYIRLFVGPKLLKFVIWSNHKSNHINSSRNQITCFQIKSFILKSNHQMWFNHDLNEITISICPTLMCRLHNTVDVRTYLANRQTREHCIQTQVVLVTSCNGEPYRRQTQRTPGRSKCCETSILTSTRISCRWQTRATRCITANVGLLQPEIWANAQRDGRPAEHR